MKKQSIWLENFKNQTKKLDTNEECDVLIIGGGITGLSTAYHLKGKNLKVILVERNEIGSGITSKTTGKITYLQELIYSKLYKEKGKEVAKLYLNSQLDAIKIVTNIIKKEKIDCDLEQVKSYVIGNNLEKEKDILKEFNIKVLEDKNAIFVDDTYVFHPIKYLVKIKEILENNNIKIYEHTNIIEIKNDIAYTKEYHIKAKNIVLACHYPFFLLPLLMPIKGYLEKSYIASISNIENKKLSAITSNNPTISLRYHLNNLIYLNGSHTISNHQNEQKNFDNLINEIKKYGTFDYIWSNQDIVTNDHLPIIGKINDSLLIATGYNTWGMTNGSLAGKIISDLILQIDNKYTDLFAVKRDKSLYEIKNILNEIVRNGKSFTLSKLINNKKWYSKQVQFKTIKNDKVGIYIDENNQKHIVYNKCPHLKCGLIFNEFEKTWDCPCHGSRFDMDGNLILGPSRYNITYKKQ